MGATILVVIALSFGFVCLVTGILIGSTHVDRMAESEFEHWLCGECTQRGYRVHTWSNQRLGVKVMEIERKAQASRETGG